MRFPRHGNHFVEKIVAGGIRLFEIRERGKQRRRGRGTIRALRCAFLGPWAVAFLCAWAVLPGAARAADSAVVVMYHRFGEAAYPSTNITIEQFESHLEELTSGRYTVLPLPEIVAALRAGRRLPERTVGISIDDAYLSVHAAAWPRLKKAGLPFTLFVATNPVDRGVRGYMNWHQIAELAADGVTIGSQTASHLHMAKADAERNRRELERSNGRFVDKLGRRPDLFAYPYGEAGLEAMGVVRDAGFSAAFGQHSGAFGRGDDFFFLPRFALNEAYGSLARFRLAVGSLPLPATDITPADPLIARINPPAMGFSVEPGLKGLHRLACFTSHAGQARIERLGQTRIEIRVETPFPPGRTRVNCTLPAEDGRWRWRGRQFYVSPN